MLPSAELEPAGDVPLLEELPAVDGAAALERVAVIKLNGGLATTMGLRSPKSLLRGARGPYVPGHHHRPDAGAAQSATASRLPLVLMDSEATREDDAGGARQSRRDLDDGCRPDFLQSMIPKLDAESFGSGELARRAGARVVPAGPRRRVRRAAPLGDARRAARARLPLRDDLQLGQPRRDARPADRRPHGRAARSRS